MRVVLTRAALRELEDIADRISQDDPVRAESFVAELQSKCMALATQHAMFPILPGYTASGLRRRVHRRYSIFYEVGQDTVTVLHVVHGARDYIRVVFADQGDTDR